MKKSRLQPSKNWMPILLVLFAGACAHNAEVEPSAEDQLAQMQTGNLDALVEQDMGYMTWKEKSQKEELNSLTYEIGSAIREPSRINEKEEPKVEAPKAEPVKAEKEMKLEESKVEPKAEQKIESKAEPINSEAKAEQIQPASAPTAGNAELYDAVTIVVAKGDTLGSIAKHYLGKSSEWKAIASLNPSLRDPNYIEVGQKLYVPKANNAMIAPLVDKPDPTPTRAIASEKPETEKVEAKKVEKKAEPKTVAVLKPTVPEKPQPPPPSVAKKMEHKKPEPKALAVLKPTVPEKPQPPAPPVAPPKKVEAKAEHMKPELKVEQVKVEPKGEPRIEPKDEQKSEAQPPTPITEYKSASSPHEYGDLLKEIASVRSHTMGTDPTIRKPAADFKEEQTSAAAAPSFAQKNLSRIVGILGFVLFVTVFLTFLFAKPQKS